MTSNFHSSVNNGGTVWARASQGRAARTHSPASHPPPAASRLFIVTPGFPLFARIYSCAAGQPGLGTARDSGAVALVALVALVARVALVPTLCVGTRRPDALRPVGAPSATRSVAPAFPRRAWEPEPQSPESPGTARGSGVPQ